MIPKRVTFLGAVLLLHLSGITPNVAWGAGEHCGLKPQAERVGCYEKSLDDIVRASGSRQALAALQQWIAIDQTAHQQAHPLAHHIGRISYTYDPNMAHAFLACTDAFHNGCYHGVLEAHLSRMPDLAPRDVGEICRGVQDPERPAFTHFLCIHGLGHGLTMYFKEDMFKALTYCDGLSESRDQENCYGGAFMQNIVAFNSQRNPGHAHGSHGSHEGTAEPRKYLDPNDPLYPCTAVAKKYQRSCYLMQSSAIMALNGQNFSKAFSVCQKAPAEYLSVCVQSIGRDISGFTLSSPEATKAICSITLSELIGECLRGASKDFIYANANAQRAIALCRAAEDANKNDCYKGIGEVLVDFYPKKEQRREACRSAEWSYRGVCRGAKWWLLWLN